MPAGFQINDPSGSEIFDGTSRMARVLGYQTISSSGSVTNADFATGTPFYFFMSDNFPDNWRPAISFSGNTLTWSYTGMPGGVTPTQGIIYYGVY